MLTHPYKKGVRSIFRQCDLDSNIIGKNGSTHWLYLTFNH
jgi:hypothetical protein